MTYSFKDSVEKIAYMQFQKDEYIDKLTQLELEIIQHSGEMSTDKKLQLVGIIEDLKPHINNILQDRIRAIKKNMDF